MRKSSNTPLPRTPKAEQTIVQKVPEAPLPKGKLGAVADLIARSQGARIDELMAATGWQAHSVRGAIAGALNKKFALNITSAKTDDGRVYRLGAGEGA